MLVCFTVSISCPSFSQGPHDFVLSASSAAQLRLLESLDDLQNALLCVEGPHRIWMKKTEQLYYSVTLSPWRTEDVEQSSEGDPAVCVTCVYVLRVCVCVCLRVCVCVYVCVCGVWL